MGKPESRRQIRMASVLLEHLSKAVREHRVPVLVDPVTHKCPEIIEIQVSPDLRRIVVFWGPPIAKQKPSQVDVERWTKRMERSRPALRSVIATHVRTRFLPEIDFKLDRVLDDVEQVDRLMRRNQRLDALDSIGVAVEHSEGNDASSVQRKS